MHGGGNQVQREHFGGPDKKHSGMVTVTIPRDRLMKEGYMEDDYLLNQLDGVNDNPQEDGLPLRKYLLREAHAHFAKNPRDSEVVVRTKDDKSNRTQFCFICPKEE